MADFGDAVVAPVWPCDQASLDGLLADLLNPRSEPSVVNARAVEWLAAQPRGAMWVVDDGGVVDQEKRPVPFIGVANLTGKATTTSSWIGGREPASPDLRTVGPWAATTLVPQRGETVAEDGVRPVGEAQVFLGQLTASIPVNGEAAAVLPPGAAISGFVPDMTIESWLYALTPAADQAWATSASLFKAAPSQREQAGGSEWHLFVECRLVPGQGSLNAESVTVVLGPAAKPLGVYRVDISGNVQSMDPEGTVTGPWPSVRVARGADSWSFRLPLPEAAIESKAHVRLGLVRQDALARRSGWPRAMMPWQRLPTRALFDLSRWSLVR